MSRSFLYIFSNLFKHISEKHIVKIAGVGTVSNLLYVIASKDKKEIEVVKKYHYDSHGFTHFMLIDKNGNHYDVNNSMWFMKWDSIEDWTMVDINDKILIKYYGLRIPFLGMFPKIVSTKKL